MELYELLEKKSDIEADIKYYKKEKERLEIKTGLKSPKLNVLKIQSGKNSQEQALIEFAQISMDLDTALDKLKNITTLIDDKYTNFTKCNNSDKQIYMEKKLFKWTNEKISQRHNGISKSSIYRIIEKIENLKN